MTTAILTAYVLMWPVIVGGVLVVLSRAFYAEWRDARKSGRDIV